jgi:hypothetical protein
MERRNPRSHKRRAEQCLDASTHFFRCFIGEGDGKNFIVLGVPFRQQVRNALRDHARLARAGAG